MAIDIAATEKKKEKGRRNSGAAMRDHWAKHENGSHVVVRNPPPIGLLPEDKNWMEESQKEVMAQWKDIGKEIVSGIVESVAPPAPRDAHVIPTPAVARALPDFTHMRAEIHAAKEMFNEHFLNEEEYAAAIKRIKTSHGII